MNNLSKTAILTAAILVLAAAPASAQHDRLRGESSPGAQIPSSAALMQAIENGSPERLAAMLEYGERLECMECVPLLERQLLESDDALVREMAAWWLRRRGVGFAAVYREIRLVLQTDSDPVRRARAAEAIGEFMDPHGVAHLSAALSDTDARVRAAAVAGLGRINAPAGNVAIVSAFTDADATVREAAVGQVLIVNQFRDFDALMGLLSDSSIQVRRQAALALGTFRVGDAVPALSAMLSDGSSAVRMAAALGARPGRDHRRARRVAGPPRDRRARERSRRHPDRPAHVTAARPNPKRAFPPLSGGAFFLVTLHTHLHLHLGKRTTDNGFGLGLGRARTRGFKHARGDRQIQNHRGPQRATEKDHWARADFAAARAGKRGVGVAKRALDARRIHEPQRATEGHGEGSLGARGLCRRARRERRVGVAKRALDARRIHEPQRATEGHGEEIIGRARTLPPRARGAMSAS